MSRVAALLMSLFFVACGRGGYVDMQPVSPYSWSKPVSIIVENDNTERVVDIAVALRYNDNLESDTLSVTLQTSLPDARQVREELLLHLNREYSAAAVTASETVPYRTNCTLNQSGYYIFTITPSRAVKGVEAVGIELVENGKR